VGSGTQPLPTHRYGPSDGGTGTRTHCPPLSTHTRPAGGGLGGPTTATQAVPNSARLHRIGPSRIPTADSLFTQRRAISHPALSIMDPPRRLSTLSKHPPPTTKHAISVNRLIISRGSPRPRRRPTYASHDGAGSGPCPGAATKDPG
jgi:hypothetical protein